MGELGTTESFLRYLGINATIDPVVNFIQDTPITLSFALGGMFIGFWLGRIGYFHRPEEHARRSLRWIALGSTLGIAASGTFWMLSSGRLELTPALSWLVFLILGGMLLQSLCYIALFVRLGCTRQFRGILHFFAPTGRMAFSTYILQSVLYHLVFFHALPGLQLYGALTYTETMGMAVLLYSLQVALSRWWLKRHAQGPVEYLWKKLAYLPLRRSAAPVA